MTKLIAAFSNFANSAKQTTIPSATHAKLEIPNYELRLKVLLKTCVLVRRKKPFRRSRKVWEI